MKIKVLLFLIIVLVMGTISFAQDSSKHVNPFPFAQINDPGSSLVQEIDNPPGFARYSAKKLTQYQLWLSNLPLMPVGTPLLNWKGKKIAKADPNNRVLDMKIESKYVTDADVPLLLMLHFLRLNNMVDSFNIRLEKNMNVNYHDWLRGEYVVEKNKPMYFKGGGLNRVDSEEEFYKYMDFVTKHFDTKSLRLNVKHTNSRSCLASHFFIQFKEDDPDSIGHVALVLDVAIAEYEPRKMLVAYGGKSGQSVIVLNAGKTEEPGWITLDQLREQLSEFGMGYMYNWVN